MTFLKFLAEMFLDWFAPERPFLREARQLAERVYGSWEQVPEEVKAEILRLSKCWTYDEAILLRHKGIFKDA